MRYLYGDATPFPLDENFLDTLVDATDACVALLRLDAAAEKIRREAQQARIVAAAELTELEGMAKGVHQALARHTAGESAESPAQVAARKVLLALGATMKQSRANILRKRDAAVRKTGIDHTAEAILEVLGAFLSKRELPDTVWRLRWKAIANSAPTQAHLHARANPINLEAVFEVDVPNGHAWNGPVRVDQLASNIALELHTARGLMRTGSKMKRVSLDKFWITEVEVSPERAAMVLSRSAKEPSHRLQIVLASPEQSEPTARWLDAKQGESSEAQGIRETDIPTIERLWERIEETIADLIDHRSRVILATLDKKSVRELERPQTLAEAILEAIGPLTRELRRRSRVPGEISLKRDLGDGRREELFIPKERLASKFASLSDEYRHMFDAFGLEGTAEIVTIERHADFASKPKERIARGTSEVDEEHTIPKEVPKDGTLRLVTAATPA